VAFDAIEMCNATRLLAMHLQRDNEGGHGEGRPRIDSIEHENNHLGNIYEYSEGKDIEKEGESRGRWEQSVNRIVGKVRTTDSGDTSTACRSEEKIHNETVLSKAHSF